jgi:hypothetical protein
VSLPDNLLPKSLPIRHRNYKQDRNTLVLEVPGRSVVEKSLVLLLESGAVYIILWVRTESWLPFCDD